MSYGIRRTIVLAALPFLRLYGQRTEFVASRAAATSGTFASQAPAIPPLVTEPLAFPRLFLFFELLLAVRPLAAPCQLFPSRISCNGNTNCCIGTRETRLTRLTRLKYRNLSNALSLSFSLSRICSFFSRGKFRSPSRLEKASITIRTFDGINIELL